MRESVKRRFVLIKLAVPLNEAARKIDLVISWPCDLCTKQITYFRQSPSAYPSRCSRSSLP